MRNRGAGREPGNDGGVEMVGETWFCECLFAALAKKNKAGATLGSDFSIGGMAGNWFLWGEGGGLNIISFQRRQMEIGQPSELGWLTCR